MCTSGRCAHCTPSGRVGAARKRGRSQVFAANPGLQQHRPQRGCSRISRCLTGACPAERSAWPSKAGGAGAATRPGRCAGRRVSGQRHEPPQAASTASAAFCCPSMRLGAGSSEKRTKACSPGRPSAMSIVGRPRSQVAAEVQHEIAAGRDSFEHALDAAPRCVAAGRADRAASALRRAGCQRHVVESSRVEPWTGSRPQKQPAAARSG